MIDSQTIHEQFYKPIFRYTLKLCHDENLAETITADAFSAVLEKMSDDQDAIRNVRAYLYQTAYHKVIDHSRENNRLAPLDLAVNEIEFLADETGIDLQTIQRWLRDNLSPTEYKIFALRVLERLNVADTAAATGKSRNNIRKVLSCARRKLREVYSNREFDLAPKILRRKPKRITLNKLALKGKWAKPNEFDWMLTEQEFLMRHGYPQHMTGSVEKFLRNYHRQLVWLAREKGLLE